MTGIHSGLFWCLLAAGAWGICPILERIGLLKLSPLVILFIQSLTVTLLLGLYLLVQGKEHLETLQSSSVSTLLLIIGCACLGGIIGEYAYLRSILDGETAKSVAITSAYPLVTVLLSILFLGEGITLVSGLGIALITCGVYCLSA